jgi:hypothetical protein
VVHKLLQGEAGTTDQYMRTGCSDRFFQCPHRAVNLRVRHGNDDEISLDILHERNDIVVGKVASQVVNLPSVFAQDQRRHRRRQRVEIASSSRNHRSAAGPTAMMVGEARNDAIADCCGPVLFGDADGTRVPSQSDLGHTRGDDVLTQLDRTDLALGESFDGGAGGKLIAGEQCVEKPVDVLGPTPHANALGRWCGFGPFSQEPFDFELGDVVGVCCLGCEKRSVSYPSVDGLIVDVELGCRFLQIHARPGYRPGRRYRRHQPICSCPCECVVSLDPLPGGPQ